MSLTGVQAAEMDAIELDLHLHLLCSSMMMMQNVSVKSLGHHYGRESGIGESN